MKNKPFIFETLVKGRHPARENDGAIEKAVEAVQTEGTLDPEQQKTNDTFEAEIKKLQEQQSASENPDGSPEGGENGADGGGPDGGNAEDGTGAAGQGQEGQGSQEGEGSGEIDTEALPKDASVTEEEQAQAEGEVDQEVANGEGSAAPDPEEASANDTAPVEVEKALEALSYVATSYEALRNAHETGVIRPLHINLARESMNAQARRVKIKGVTFARESGIISGVVDFIARLLRSIRDFVANIFKWVADMFRGWHARRGTYAATQEGVKDRIQALKDTKAEIKSNEKGETINIPKLMNWHGNDINSVTQAVADLEKIQGVAIQAVASQEFANLILGVITFMMHGLASAKNSSLEDAVSITVAKLPALDQQLIFGRHGAATGFGNEPFFRDSIQVTKGSVNNSTVVNVGNLIGGNVLRWTVQSAPTSSLKAYAEGLRGLDCNISQAGLSRSGKGLAEIQLLLTVQEIEQAMTYRAIIEKRATDLLDLSKRTTAYSKKLSEQSTAALKAVEGLLKLPNIDPAIAANLGVLFGSAPEAYNRMATASLAKIAGILMGVCDGLDTLIKASMAAIDKKMGEGQPKGKAEAA